jgi:hypothetical protein
VVGDRGIEHLDGTIDLGAALSEPRLELSPAGRDTNFTVEPDALGLGVHPSVDPGNLLIRPVATSTVRFGGPPAERIDVGHAPKLEVPDDSLMGSAHGRLHLVRELGDELVALFDA